MALMEELMKQLGGGALKQISGQLGTDEGTTSNAMAAAVPMLLGALSRNASNPDGASSLSNALSKDHDGSILDNLSGFLGNAEQGPGASILKHVLGGRQKTVEQGLGKSTGMDSAAAGKLLTMLAPIVMGQLGKASRQSGMDANALSGLLNQERSNIEKKAPAEMGILGQLLDADGDGDVDLGDVAKKGFGMLGGFFKKS